MVVQTLVAGGALASEVVSGGIDDGAGRDIEMDGARPVENSAVQNSSSQ
jgi:hypothetical protein